MKSKKLLSTLAIVSVVLFAGCKNDDYIAINVGPCPVVVSVSPVSGAMLVGRSKVISTLASQEAARVSIVTATFNKKIDPKTINESSFTVKIVGESTVAGTVTYTDSTAVFVASNKFADDKTLEARITTAVKDLAGNAMQADYVWTFSTGTTILPVVTATDPLNLVTGVALNKTVSVNFSMSMDPSTITTSTFTVNTGSTSILGTVNYSGTTATFNPTTDFLPNTTYTARITSAVKNSDGTALLKDTVWTFSTGNFVPVVVFANPANLDANVVLNKIVSATFNVTMDPATITTSTFTVYDGLIPVTGVVNYSCTVATFTPGSNLTAGKTYTATITTGAKSVTNKALASNYTWTFSTPLIAGSPTFVNLGSVERFAIISGVGVSNNAGASVINNMDVGIYPGARSSITGFPPAIIVNGGMYAADDGAAIAAMLNLAKLDLVVAYLFAESCITMPPQTVAGNQGGKTLAPGIYKSTSTLSVDGSDLTLDAQGDPNAYWIFQVASTLTTTTGGNIVLTNGAQAKNIFWQTGSSATIGTYTKFNGSILALQSITMDSYAEATGRMLARNGAVVLTSTNIINKP
jgi:hypothetical protein